MGAADSRAKKRRTKYWTGVTSDAIIEGKGPAPNHRRTQAARAKSTEAEWAKDFLGTLGHSPQRARLEFMCALSSST
jgi:hypothetical protein